MTIGKRQKEVRHLTDAGTGTLGERLFAANAVLHEAISPIDNKGRAQVLPDPLLIADLQLSTDEYHWTVDLLGEALQSIINYPQRFSKLFNDYPMVVLSALVGATLLDRGESYWDRLWNRLQVRESSVFYDIIRKQLVAELRKKKLATFDGASLIGGDHVGTIQLHAGIISRDVELIAQAIEELEVQGQTFKDSGVFAQFVSSSLSNNEPSLNSSVSLRRLALHLPERAQDIFARLYEIHGWYRSLDDKQDIDNFSGTHGLPEPAFSFLLKVLSGQQVSSQADTMIQPPSDFPDPRVEIDLETLEVFLVFPKVTREQRAGHDAPVWTVNTDESSRKVEPSEDWSSGGFDELRVNLAKPFANLSVIKPGGERLSLVENLGGQQPALFLNQAGRQLKNQHQLRNQKVLALAPSEMFIRATTVNNRSFAPQDLGSPYGWSKWVLKQMHLDHVSTLTMSHRGHRTTVDIKKFSGPVWSQDSTIPHLKGPDRLPVFDASPTVWIPRDSHTWTLHYAQLLPDGTTLPMDPYGVEDSLRRVHFPLFESVNDPWVGQFRVSILRDGRLLDQKVFNLAEGLKLKLDYEQPHEFGPFQIPMKTPQGSPTLRKVLIDFSSAPDSGLLHPTETQALRNPDENQPFTVASTEDPETYSLQVSVEPPKMTYRLPLRQEISVWSTGFKTFDFSEIAEGEDFQLRFPTAVHDVRITLAHAHSRKDVSKVHEISLSRTRSNTWSVPVTRLLMAMDSDAEFSIVASWNALTAEEWVERKFSERDQKRWRRTSADMREDPRKPSVVTLFQVTKNPLVRATTLEGNQLTVELGRESSLPLKTWAWQIHRPLDPPVHIPMNGRTGTVPPELVDEGPLIVETREEEFLTFWEPESPSAQAVIADQPSLLELRLDVTNDHRWLFYYQTAQELLPQEIQVVWEARDKMHYVLGRKESRSIPSLLAFDEATSSHLLRDPRVSLNELDRSPIPHERQFEAFIRSGLHTRSFETEETSGDIHPVPWIGLIQELNDLHAIAQSNSLTDATREERLESERYVKQVGGINLWKIFKGHDLDSSIIRGPLPREAELKIVRESGTELIREMLDVTGAGAPLISEESRLIAQLEWLDNRRDITANMHLWNLYAVTKDKEHLIDRLDDPELKLIARDLCSIAEEQRRSEKENWLYAPYISFVQSLLARMMAHEVIFPIQELKHLNHAWATLARRIPLLTGFDLVCAEATVLSASTR